MISVQLTPSSNTSL